MSLEGLSKAVVALRKRKGFYTPRAISGDAPGTHRTKNAELMLAKLMLVVTEVSEAAEACRDEDLEKMGAELADVLIRVLDIAGTCGIDLGAHVRGALVAWSRRPVLHGQKIRL